MAEKDILLKLERIEHLLLELLELEREQLDKERIIERLEAEQIKQETEIAKMEADQLKNEETIKGQEDQELSQLKEATKKLQFTDVSEWQMYIWQECKYKKDVKGSKEVSYYCEKRQGPCKFDGCPLNVM